MAEKFDLIVVGGGHNGLACGAYLAKAGLKTLVLERRDLIGGGVMTEEHELPGFKHNTHSAMHEWIFAGPVYYDLELKNYGSKYKFGPGLAQIFEDGSSIILYRELERTCNQLAKYSKKDAKAYKEMVETFTDYLELLCTSWLYNPPMPQSQFAALLEGTDAGKDILRMMLSSPLMITEQMFEHEKTKAWVLLNVTQTGIPHDCYGNGLMFPLMLPALHRTGIGTSVGGSISLALAMGKFVEAHGGVVKKEADVKEILIKDGRAYGVKLADGSEYHAEKAITCNVGPTLIFGKDGMVDQSLLNDDFIKQINRWRPGEVALFTMHLDLNESIDYKAAATEPDVNRTYTVGMCDTVERLQKQFNAARIGEIPRGDAVGFLTVCS
ncbi:MAG: NAD(P)/FAD-dependent oxidoreductase, partial [Thermodesulfobacteriota bacterium]|nr:NAD(P)/FAD-dependent oxidoreductase [Thermodesulfobacteriota bacterium]